MPEFSGKQQKKQKPVKSASSVPKNKVILVPFAPFCLPSLPNGICFFPYSIGVKSLLPLFIWGGHLSASICACPVKSAFVFI